jgi:hypothetical protein
MTWRQHAILQVAFGERLPWWSAVQMRVTGLAVAAVASVNEGNALCLWTKSSEGGWSNECSRSASLCLSTCAGSDVTASDLALHARYCTTAFSCCIMRNFHTVQSLLLHQLFTNPCDSLPEDQNVANPCNIRPGGPILCMHCCGSAKHNATNRVSVRQ